MYINTGRIGKDIELKYVGANNTACATFPMAFDYGFGDKKRTEWMNVTAWGKRAEVLAKFCRKGDLFTVFAEPFTRKWQDKEGKDRYTTDWTIVDFKIITFHDAAEIPQASNESSDGFYSLEDDNELPF